MRLLLVCFAALGTLVLGAGNAAAFTVDFEDVGARLPLANPDSGEEEFFYDGFVAARAGEETDFESGGARFSNDFTEFFPGCCWQGWAYSQTTDTITPGFQNELSAIPGSGVFGSATYGVGFPSPDPSQQAQISRLSFPRPVAMVGGYFTNTTFAALTMRDGDAFSKKFGGATGEDPDFFTLTIRGVDEAGETTGEVTVDLADFRFDESALDFILTDWRWVDLAPLGTVSALEFGLRSSDEGFFGLNTPAYFAMDDLMYMPGKSRCTSPPGRSGAGAGPSDARRCNLGRASQGGGSGARHAR